MGQRLVLRSTDKKVTLADLRAFVKKCDEYNLPSSLDLDVADDINLSVSLPKDQRVVNGKRVRVKGKTKRGRAVEDQIQEHKDKKKNGGAEGHVPPVDKKTGNRRVKCPKCNVRKQVVTVGGVKVIKPHLSHGEACPGSSMQVGRR